MAYATIDIGDAASVDDLWSKSDDYAPENIELGFRVDVQQTAPYIVGVVDGSSAADGNPITNKGGYVHNGAESKIKQTDNTMLGLAGDGSDTLWSDDGVAFKEVSYADLLAHASGNLNLWNKWSSIDGVCHLQESFQYDFAKVLTEAEHTKNASYVGVGGGCGSIAPFPSGLDFSQEKNSMYIPLIFGGY